MNEWISWGRPRKTSHDVRNPILESGHVNSRYNRRWCTKDSEASSMCKYRVIWLSILLSTIVWKELVSYLLSLEKNLFHWLASKKNTIVTQPVNWVMFPLEAHCFVMHCIKASVGTASTLALINISLLPPPPPLLRRSPSLPPLLPTSLERTTNLFFFFITELMRLSIRCYLGGGCFGCGFELCLIRESSFELYYIFTKQLNIWNRKVFNQRY